MEHEELFVDLDWWPNYAVSNYGRVINIKRGTDLKPSKDSHGFLRVALFHGGYRTEVYVHRLVAQAFFLNYSDFHEVKHINGDTTENTVLNLTLGDKRIGRRGR